MRWLLAILGGAVVGGGVAYLCAMKTKRDLTTAGAELQSGLEAAGRMTDSQLRAAAQTYAQQIATFGQQKIQAVAASTALDVVQVQYGITPAFVTQARTLGARIASGEARVLSLLGGG